VDRIFISYRRADAPDAVARLHERLTARLRNREVFYDHTSLELGDVFPDRLREQVTTAGVVLVVIGPNWAAELRNRAADTAKLDFVREEVRLALASGHTVIPVLVGGAKMPSEADFAPCPELLPLRRLNAQTVRPDPLFAAECDKLIAHLERTGPSEIVGTILGGKYKVVRLHAEGGMGEVYEAAQTDMKRTVAVKLIKPGMDTKEVLARFDAERQALAVMDHPNVCRVLDAGTAPAGRPFFVMEFVRGVPITQFCDDRKLPPKDRLELFTAVCRAVQHAHQKGIIHRDIKPGNVLVEVIDGQPVPKVIDFGLAKALGRRLTDQSMAATEFGQWVGTLEYSSPEQAEGRFDIDTLTDVYSLGVLLHELLVGSTPFTRDELLATSQKAAQEMIATKEPTAPSVRLSSSKNLPAIAADRHLDPTALAKAVRGDLDWIILKALSKEKNGRYPTPTALADDIARHLTDQPISAGKPSAWVRLRKFYRRNRPQVIAGGLVAAVLVAGIVGTTLALLESDRQKTIARIAEKATAEQLDKTRKAEAEAKAKTVEAEASLATVSERTRMLSDVYGQLVWGLQDQLESLAGAEPLRRELLTTTRDGLRRIVADAGDGAAVEESLLWAHFRLGELELSLGDLDAAEKEFRVGVDVAARWAEREPGERMARLSLHLGYLHLGDLALRRGGVKAAADLYDRAVAEARKLMAADPGDQLAARALAGGYDKLGDIAHNSGRAEDALKAFRTVLDLTAGMNPLHAGDVAHLHDRGVAHLKIGNVLMDLGKTEEAAAEFARGEGVFRPLAAERDDTPIRRGHAGALERLGTAAARLGDGKKAREYHRESLALTRRLATDFPANVALQRDFSLGVTNAGKMAQAAGDLDEALRLFEEARAVRAKLAERLPQDAHTLMDLSTAEHLVGDVHRQRERYPEAAAAYQRSREAVEGFAATHPGRTDVQRALLLALERELRVQILQRKLKDAEEKVARAMAVATALADGDPKNATYQNDLARQLESAGDILFERHRTVGKPALLEQAIESFDRAIALRAKLLAADGKNAELLGSLYSTHHQRANAYLKLNRTQEALKDAERALELATGAAAPEHVGRLGDLIQAHYLRGRVAIAAG
jgi:serine/threonine protein kinase/tetratricopeptide (TPR) repeat protein